jgi:hypothetical protein
VQNEGDIGVGTKGPYEIAYGSLVPQREQCENLLVPICVSSSHIAFGSIRMEPVFMILGQSAATAAVLAIDAGQAVQEVPYVQLSERLLQDGQVLHYAGSPAHPAAVDPKKLSGTVVDDSQAKLTGTWKESTANPLWVGASYRHDDNAGDGQAIARFEAKLPQPGRYEVRLAYTRNANRASNVPVEIHHAQGVETVVVNQQKPAPIDGLFLSLGVFEFAGGVAAVQVSNRDTDGYVIADAVQWLAAER